MPKLSVITERRRPRARRDWSELMQMLAAPDNQNRMFESMLVGSGGLASSGTPGVASRVGLGNFIQTKV